MELNELTDIEIWASFKKGNDVAFAHIYSTYAKRLFHYGLKFTSDHLLVEDAIHDLFTLLIKKRKRLGDTNNILFYLLKALKRILLRKLEKEKRLLYSEETPNYKFDISWSVEQQIIIEETIQYKNAILLKALNSLTPRQKEAVYLRFTKELDYQSVAEIMGVSVEACRNLISKAISVLKQNLFDKEKNSIVLLAISLKTASKF